MDTICRFCENRYGESNEMEYGNWKNSPMIIVCGNDLDITIPNKDGENACDNFTINYCPMCGREL